MIPSGWLSAQKHRDEPHTQHRPATSGTPETARWLWQETDGAFNDKGDTGREEIARRLLWCQWRFRTQYRERGGVE